MCPETKIPFPFPNSNNCNLTLKDSMTCRLKLDIVYILSLTWMFFLPLIAHKRLVSVKLGLARANQVLKWSHASYSKLEFQKYHF